MLSIFERFKRKRLEEYEEGEETFEAAKAVEEGPEPEVARPVEMNDRSVDRLLSDIWADREQHPEDMQAVEFFLPALRDRMESHDLKCQAAEVLAKKDPDDVLKDESGRPVEIKQIGRAHV